MLKAIVEAVEVGFWVKAKGFSGWVVRTYVHQGRYWLTLSSTRRGPGTIYLGFFAGEEVQVRPYDP